MIEAASEVFLVADSNKFGNSALASLGNMGDIDCIITDSGVDSTIAKRLEDAGVKVVIAT
jgi:DeoR/GlpR family transcriptional regulator of sugar metabolism